ncbi:hypothetical protein GCM10022200_20720 [Microbacterium awajiense]|uniref:HTH gntR-type domain-containing protein n=1 Tax=Microbacterium awajiense TaxID=415214 RepID=A0ABP7ANZ0_9MICO
MTTFSPLDPRGTVLGDEVYLALGEAIIDGTLPPGERLRDQDLAQRLGVSRTPVREALQRLERAGLVEVAPNRYTRVSASTEKVQRDTLEFVVHFLGAAVKIAVEHADDAGLADLVAAADDVVEASRADDVPAIFIASERLFDLSVIATENVAFLKILREGELAFRHYLSRWQPAIQCPASRTVEYERFREAVADRDGATAERLFRTINGFS